MHCERYRETLPTNWLHPHRRWLVGTLRALVGISMGKDSFCCRNNEPKHASKLCENYSRTKENQGILDISPTVTWPDPCRIFTIWGTDCAVPYFLLYILLQWWILLLKIMRSMYVPAISVSQKLFCAPESLTGFLRCTALAMSLKNSPRLILLFAMAGQSEES